MPNASSRFTAACATLLHCETAPGLLPLVRELEAGGATLVLVTHNLVEGIALATRAVIMRGGRFVYDEQTPEGGETAKKGSLVTLTLAKAPAPTPTPTPTPAPPATPPRRCSSAGPEPMPEAPRPI